MENCEAMTSSTHSFAYSYGLVKNCFLKICETSKFHNFLIFQPIFIRFSLFCSENFTLSSEIKLHQLRTSPLRTPKFPNGKINNGKFACVIDNGDFVNVYTKLQTMWLCPSMQYNKIKSIVHCNCVCAKSRIWRAGGCATSWTSRAESSNAYLEDEGVILCDCDLANLTEVLDLDIFNLDLKGFVTKHLREKRRTPWILARNVIRDTRRGWGICQNNWHISLHWPMTFYLMNWPKIKYLFINS